MPDGVGAAHPLGWGWTLISEAQLTRPLCMLQGVGLTSKPDLGVKKTQIKAKG